MLPSTQPVVDGKTQIEYALRKAEQQVATLIPFGTITEKMLGENLAEMYDMSQSGTRFFTDDAKYLSTGILYRALLYSKTFGGKDDIVLKKPLGQRSSGRSSPCVKDISAQS